MAGLLYRLGQFAARRPWQVIVAWVLILVLGGVSYGLFAGTISSTITVAGTATTQVQDELAEKFPKASGGSGTIVFATKDHKAFTTREKAGIERFLTDVKRVKDVKGTTNPFTSQSNVADQRKQIADGAKQLAASRQQIADAQNKVNAGTTQSARAQQELDAQKAQAQAAGQLGTVQAQLDAAQAQINAQQQELAADQQAIDTNTTKLKADQVKLTQGSALLDLSRNIRFVSTDGSAAVATVSFTKATYEVPLSSKTEISNLADSRAVPGVNVEVSDDIAPSNASIVGPGEVVGIIIAAIVLFIMLGTVMGAALPLASALLGVGVAVLGASSFSNLVQFDSVTTILAIMLGLAVGIDYSLFILNRHRSQMKRGIGLHESIGLANGTSGNAVVFAGSTVIVALLALNVTGVAFLGLMGTVGAVAVAIAILIAITFTPALMSILGMRLLRKKEREAVGMATAAQKMAKPIDPRRAAVTLVLGVAVLGTIALPALQMRLGLPDGSSEPVKSSQYQAFETVGEKFGNGQNGPLVAVAEMPGKIAAGRVTAQEITIGKAIVRLDDVSAVVPVGASADRSVIAFEVIPKGGPSSVSTENLVKNLRILDVKVDGGRATFGVAGTASANIDVSGKLADVLPLYLVVVVGLSLIILIIVFRSFLVPVTATAGFVLSLLASFGALTAVYQFGWLGAVFGVHDPGPVLSFLPIIEVGVLFGLAMDYQLFLVSGMRESYAHGTPAKVAVQQGLRAGRSVVTAAAIIMTAVFAGFIFSDSATTKPIGFALAFGVLLDAFVVRMLLIPAAMTLLGKAAWWFPGWLGRIVPDVDVEGSKLGDHQGPVTDAESSETRRPEFSRQ